MLARTILAVSFTLALAGASAADESGSFIVKLGADTTSVEHYTRTGSRVEVNQVGRAPRVLQRHFVYDLKDGALTHLTVVVTPPGSATPTQTIDVTPERDSLRIETRNGPASQITHVAVPPGIVIVASSSPWTMYEGQAMKLSRSRADSLRAPMYFLGAPGTGWLTLTKLGRDSVVVWNDHGDLFHARVDRDGRIQGVLPIAGTAKFGVTRVASLDLPGYTDSFAGRELRGAGLGVLSPRDTVRASAAGATLWIDYGRPAKRGRAVYGGIVPYGEVWRTGANAATQFRTDKDLVINGTPVPAGFYTLWTLPTATGWKLIINSETGQWGTAHNPAKDLYTISTNVNALPDPVEKFTITIDPNANGGALNFDWDTTRVQVPFTVKQ